MLTPVEYTDSFSETDLIWNAVVQFYRSRVEHIYSSFKRHSMFSYIFRGSIDTLTDALYVNAHTTNIYLRSRIRYCPVGPWVHF